MRRLIRCIMSSINDYPRLVLVDADMATRRTSKANGEGDSVMRG